MPTLWAHCVTFASAKIVQTVGTRQALGSCDGAARTNSLSELEEPGYSKDSGPRHACCVHGSGADAKWSRRDQHNY